MEQATAIGPVRFALERVEHRVFDTPELRPFALLDDGTAVQCVGEAAGLYLVIDHRRNPENRARVELWRGDAEPEGGVAGLLVLCDAAD